MARLNVRMDLHLTVVNYHSTRFDEYFGVAAVFLANKSNQQPGWSTQVELHTPIAHFSTSCYESKLLIDLIFVGINHLHRVKERLQKHKKKTIIWSHCCCQLFHFIELATAFYHIISINFLQTNAILFVSCKMQQNEMHVSFFCKQKQQPDFG